MKNIQCRNVGFLRENRIKQATEMCSNQLITHYLLVIQKTVYDIFQRGKKKKELIVKLITIEPYLSFGEKKRSPKQTHHNIS